MTKKVRTLLVEDEADVRSLMLLHLEREGHEVRTAEGGEEALNFLRAETFDLIILDWMLPDLSGLDLCKRIQGKAPILMVTARTSPADVVLGLEMGADDYVGKPFDISVFLARVRNLLRRDRRPPRTSSKIKIGNLSVDLESRAVRCAETESSLTPSEYKLLVALLDHQGKILTRTKLIELIQGEGIAVIDRAIDTLVFGLRKKLGDCADVVETVRGVGYRVRAANDDR